jgi:hypothetical protein
MSFLQQYGTMYPATLKLRIFVSYFMICHQFTSDMFRPQSATAFVLDVEIVTS